MLKWVFGHRRKSKPTFEAPPYEEARRLAAEGSTKERADLARCEDLPPEFLYYFASDVDAEVRSVVAANPGTPLQADLILAKDREVVIRAMLATKIANIIPEIRPDQTEKLADLTFEVLEILAHDQEVQVRQIVAESIKSLDHVPKPIIQHLARDLEESISMPVLEYSPLLDDQDLLNLILTGVSSKSLAAVSRREDLTVELIDAIVDTDDEIAVEALIGNEKAQIPDGTFDTIVDRSVEREGWQAALASRISVPGATLRKLSKLATESVLRRLMERADLDEELQAELQIAVEGRFKSVFDEPNVMTPEEVALEKAIQLLENGMLTDERIQKAIADGDKIFMEAALAVLSQNPVADIRNLLRFQSAKSIVALTWKCGLSMKIALAIQEDVMRMPATKTIKPAKDGGYPFTEEDLVWQAELLFD